MAKKFKPTFESYAIPILILIAFVFAWHWVFSYYYEVSNKYQYVPKTERQKCLDAKKAGIPAELIERKSLDMDGNPFTQEICRVTETEKIIPIE